MVEGHSPWYVEGTTTAAAPDDTRAVAALVVDGKELFPRTVTVTVAVAVDAAAQVDTGLVVMGSVQLSPETKNLDVCA